MMRDWVARFSALPAVVAAEPGWTVMASPPFPLTGDHLARYGYAWRFTAESAGAVEVSAPFARGIEDAAGGVVIEALEPALHALGIQGVRPMTGEEIALAERAGEVAPAWRAGGMTPFLLGFLRAWVAQNGLIAARILPPHPELEAALRASR